VSEKIRVSEKMMKEKINTGERRDGEKISGCKWLNCWSFEDEVRNYGE